MIDRQLDQVLQDWLDLGPGLAPDHVHDAVAVQVRATRQATPIWGPWAVWRVPRINAFAKLAIAAAAVALVAALGISLQKAGDGTRGNGASTLPLPSPETSQRPTATPSQDTARRRIVSDGIRFTLDVPDSGWESYNEILIAKSETGPQGAEAIVYWSRYPKTDDVVACGPWANSPRHSVDYLASAVQTAPGVEVVDPTSDVTIGGQAAKHMVVIVRERLGCDPGYFFNWKAQWGGALWQMTQVGDTLSVWIFDTLPTPFMIVGEANSEASQALRDEVQRIIESTRFEP
jgi:hypothetical protein